mgnify:CR=1 FL=1
MREMRVGGAGDDLAAQLAELLGPGGSRVLVLVYYVATVVKGKRGLKEI